MGFIQNIKEFIAPEEEENELELSEEEAKAVSAYEQAQDETASAIPTNANIVLFEPRGFEEAGEMANHIKHKRACCINLHKMPSELRQRTIDFLNGVVFGVGGSIKMIGENVILCSPRNLQVAGKIDVNSREEN